MCGLSAVPSAELASRGGRRCAPRTVELARAPRGAQSAGRTKKLRVLFAPRPKMCRHRAHRIAPNDQRRPAAQPSAQPVAGLKQQQTRRLAPATAARARLLACPSRMGDCSDTQPWFA